MVVALESGGHTIMVRFVQNLIRIIILALMVLSANGVLFVYEARAEKSLPPGHFVWGDNLRELLSNTTHFGHSVPSGPVWIEYFDSDGTSLLKQEELILFGVWRTEGDKLCFVYDDGAETPVTHIFRVYHDDGVFYFLARDEFDREKVINITDYVESGLVDGLEPVQRQGRSEAELNKAMSCGSQIEI